MLEVVGLMLSVVVVRVLGMVVGGFSLNLRVLFSLVYQRLSTK